MNRKENKVPKIDYATYTTDGKGEAPVDENIEEQYLRDLETFKALTDEQRGATAHVYAHMMLEVWNTVAPEYQREIENGDWDVDLDSFKEGAMEILTQLHASAETLRDPLEAIRKLIEGDGN